MTTKMLRVKLDVVVEFPEEMSSLPGERDDEAETIAALYDGLHVAICKAYGVEAKRVSGRHDIRLVFEKAAAR